jgi:cell division septal protein FtsQ
VDNRDTIQLLVEIRDLQKEYLAEYRRVTQESLEIGRKSVSQQSQSVKFQRRVLIGASVALAFFVVWLILATLAALNK